MEVDWGNIKYLTMLWVLGLIGYYFAGKKGLFLVWGVALLLQVIAILVRLIK